MGNVRRFSEILHLPKINDCRIRNLITVQEIKSLRRHVRHSVQSYSTQWKHNLQYTPMPADKFSNAENRNLPARNSKLSVPKNKKASQHKRKHLLKTSRSTPAPPLIRNNAVFPFGKVLIRLSDRYFFISGMSIHIENVQSAAVTRVRPSVFCRIG